MKRVFRFIRLVIIFSFCVELINFGWNYKFNNEKVYAAEGSSLGFNIIEQGYYNPCQFYYVARSTADLVVGKSYTINANLSVQTDFKMSQYVDAANSNSSLVQFESGYSSHSYTFTYTQAMRDNGMKLYIFMLGVNNLSNIDTTQLDLYETNQQFNIVENGWYNPCQFYYVARDTKDLIVGNRYTINTKFGYRTDFKMSIFADAGDNDPSKVQFETGYNSNTYTFTYTQAMRNANMKLYIFFPSIKSLQNIDVSKIEFYQSPESQTYPHFNITESGWFNEWQIYYFARSTADLVVGKSYTVNANISPQTFFRMSTFVNADKSNPSQVQFETDSNSHSFTFTYTQAMRDNGMKLYICVMGAKSFSDIDVTQFDLQETNQQFNIIENGWFSPCQFYYVARDTKDLVVGNKYTINTKYNFCTDFKMGIYVNANTNDPSQVQFETGYNSNTYTFTYTQAMRNANMKLYIFFPSIKSLQNIDVSKIEFYQSPESQTYPHFSITESGWFNPCQFYYFARSTTDLVVGKSYTVNANITLQTDFKMSQYVNADSSNPSQVQFESGYSSPHSYTFTYTQAMRDNGMKLYIFVIGAKSFSDIDVTQFDLQESNRQFNIVENGWYNLGQFYYIARDTKDLIVGNKYVANAEYGSCVDFKMSAAVDSYDGDPSIVQFEVDHVNTYTFTYTQAMRDANMKLYIFFEGTRSLQCIDVSRIEFFNTNIGSPYNTFNVTSADGAYGPTGNFTKSFEDLPNGENTKNINLTRFYNSLDNTQGTCFGLGWSFSYESSVKDLGGSVPAKIVKLTDGTYNTFIINPDGSYSAADSRNSLTKASDGSYTLVTKDQYTYSFNSSGYLVSVKDRNGNAITITVNGSGKVTNITDSAGRNYSVSYNSAGLIQSITDPIGRVERYEYSNNQLVRSFDPMNHVTNYSYDAQGFLNKITDNDNNLIEAITYNHQAGQDGNKVYQTTSATGNVNTYAYDNTNLKTTVTDSNGRQNIQVYDNSFTIISSTDAEGKTTTYVNSTGSNSSNETNKETDRNGNTTEYSRDGNGNVTQIKNPDSSTKVYQYDSKNNVIQEKDENGKNIYYIYDANCNNLIMKVQPLNGTDSYSASTDQSKFSITQYAYYTDSEAQQLGYLIKSLLKYLIDPNGNKTSYTYDTYGNIRTVTDGENNTTTYSYNGIGWKISAVSPNGNTTTYVYDNDGNIVKTILNGGETTRTVYDNEERKSKEISANIYNSNLDNLSANSYSADVGTRYSYNGNGTVSSIKDAAGNVTTFTYDLYGNVLTTTKPDGSIYSYAYDVMNRVIHEYYQENASAAKVTLTDYTYTILSGGKTQKQKTQYLNNTDTAVTTYIYDYAGRQLEQDNPDGTKILATYNANGTKATATDANGSVSYFKYDGLNRLTEQWTPFENSGSILYSYTRTDYDNGGRKIDQVLGKDKVSLYSVPSNVITVSYSYYNNNKLKSQTDSSGRRTDFVYDKDGYLSKQTVYVDSNTQEITEYQNNYFGKPVTKTVHVRLGDIYGNSYSDNSDKLLQTKYTYDNDGDLRIMTTPDGVTTTYGYDYLDRQISVSQSGIDENGNSTIISSSSTLNYAGKVLTTTDANKNVTTYVYDGRGNLIRKTDAMGNVSASYYDIGGRKIADVAPGYYTQGSDLSTLNRTLYAYDLMGRLITITSVYYDTTTSAWKSIVTKAYSYDANGNVIKELDALGYESGVGNTASAIINSGYGTITTYNLANKPISLLDADSKDRGLNSTVSYVYDGAGRKISETNAAGVVTTYYYDDASNLLKTTVKKTAADAEVTIKSSTYDLVGNIKTVTDGNGNVTTYDYNALNKVKDVTYPGDATMPANTVSYQYDVLGNLKWQSDSTGRVNIFTYDNQGRLLSSTEEASDGSNIISTSAKYDCNGNKRFITDGNGVTVQNTYDVLNRLISTSITVTSTGGSKTTETTTFAYDTRGNKVSETDWRGNTTQYIYDALNRLIQKIDANGKTIETLKYYDNGAQSSSYDALNNNTQYFYDKNKRLIKTIDPLNHITLQSYDNVGNISSKTDGDNNVTSYFYDQYNHLIKVTNANNENTTFTYDINGNMLTQTDGNGNTTTFEYNVANKQIRKIDNGGRTGNTGSYIYNPARTESYTYYADGSLKTDTDRNGKVTTYIYDIHGRKISEKVGTISITYTYDNNGNQLTITDSTGTTTRTYDELNRVTSKSVPNIGLSTYVYDIITGMSQGYREESTTDPKGNVTLNIYDKAQRLSSVIADGKTTTYSYFDNGNLKSVVYPNGSGEYYTYYNDNLPSTLINKKSDGTVIDSYSYTYDAAHNMLTKVDGKGTTNYTYDKLNRIKTITEPDGTVTTYTFDASGNRLYQNVVKGSTSTLTSYIYNDLNRLTSTTTKTNGAITATEVYTSDNNGNQLTSVMTPYVNGIAGTTQTTINTYDELNELIQTIIPDGSNIVNIYNGEGVRVAKAVKGVIRRYLYEGDKVVLELDVNGATIARNVYGTNLISRTVGSTKGYYFYNGHADVTSIVGEDGTVLATYYYDVYGNITSTTGNFDNPFRYSGSQYDSETGTYYLIARMYDPTTGTFLQEDSFRGDAKDPLSLNLYTYCKGNPIVYSDPTGHRAEGQLITKGSKGADVVKIQQFLIDNGYGNVDGRTKLGGYGADGDFGTYTYDAVRNYQQAKKLSVDGIVGDQTWGSMFGSVKASSPVPTPAANKVTVASGDTLTKIARDNGTTVNAILSVNNISNPNLINVNQTIYLPTSVNYSSQSISTSGVSNNQVNNNLVNKVYDSKGQGTSNDDKRNPINIVGAALSVTDWIGYDHYLVQQYILNEKPMEFMYNYNLVKEFDIPNGGRYGINGSADIVDIKTKEIWEIKSIITKNYEESVCSNESQEQLKKYIDNYPGGGAIRGKYISQFSFQKNETTDIVVKSFSANPGMLYYWEKNRKKNEEQTSSSYATQANTSQISKDTLEKITGLTGAGLVAYLIISEGSRIAFPPRNLVPVP